MKQTLKTQKDDISDLRNKWTLFYNGILKGERMKLETICYIGMFGSLGLILLTAIYVGIVQPEEVNFNETYDPSLLDSGSPPIIASIILMVCIIAGFCFWVLYYPIKY